MSLIQSGKIFSDGEQLTAAKLNQILSDATLSTSGVDGSTIIVNENDALAVRTGGIGPFSLANSAVEEDKIAQDAVTADKIASGALIAAYPVGSIYMNASDGTDPSTLLGFGTWAPFGAGKVPVGIDSSDPDFDTAGKTGGAKTHTLTTGEMPAHTHDSNVRIEDPANVLVDTSLQITVSNGQILDEENNTSSDSTTTASTGGGSAHNNLQPYIVVYMWQRTA